MFYLETIPQDQQCNDNYFQRSYGSFAFSAVATPAILLSGDANIVQSMDFMDDFPHLQYSDKEKTRCKIIKIMISTITCKMVESN